MRAKPNAGIPCLRRRRSASSAGSARTATSLRSGVSPVHCPLVVDSRVRRLAALIDGLTAAHADGLLVTSLPNIRYLTGFSGSSALLFVSARDTVLVSDFRYQTQLADEVADLARIVIH